MPKPNQKSQQAKIAVLEAQLATVVGERGRFEQRLQDAEAGRNQACADAAELKRLLAEEREETARLRGYIQHGHEMDDAVSDRVAVHTAPEKLVPRSRLGRVGNDMADGGRVDARAYTLNEQNGGWSVVERKPAPRHWTELG